MPFVAVIVKWCLENSRMLRYGAVALGIGAAIAWIYHRGASHEAASSQARTIETAVQVKEQYDEISNHRPDDRRLLDLLQHGRF